MMVIRRTTYPQVDPRAAGLMTGRVVVIPAQLPIAEAARLGQRRRARLLAARLGGRGGESWGAVTPATLTHALRLGLGPAPVAALLWGAPVVEAGAPEVSVRRCLGPGAPFALVGGSPGPAGPGSPLGAVWAEPGAGRHLPRSVAPSLARVCPPAGVLLERAGTLGDGLGCAVVAVGGFVRDLLLHERHPGRFAVSADLDLAVEGDGPALARRLGHDLGGAVREHPTFLSATVELPGSRRVDVMTARRERYAAPGALPHVEPGPIAADLARRDFSVNAIAVRLNRAVWGEIVDPTGGLADLHDRRLRVLHPLSFVEDPTRVFRAIRFTLRLGFRLDPTTARLLRSAAAWPGYGALSGDRLRAELEAVLGEPAPGAVLTRLGRLGGLRLLLPEYRFSPGAARLVAAVTDAAGDLPLGDETRTGLYILALTAHLGDEGAVAWGARLALPPARQEGLCRARREAAGLAADLRRAAGPGAASARLSRVPELVAAWTHVATPEARVRRHIAAHLRHWRTLPPLLRGADLAALGARPGPAFGRLLEALKEAQVTGRVRQRAEAIAWMRRALAGEREAGGATSGAHRTRPGEGGG